MRRRLLLQLGLLWTMAFAVSTASAQTRPTRVFVRAPAPDQAALERLIAELRSEGFDARLVAADGHSSCAPPATREQTDRGVEQGLPFAGVELDLKANGALLVARICRVPAPERVVVSAPREDAAHFALAVVEALNGLSTSPGSAAPPVYEAMPARAPSASVGAPSALNASALLLLQPTGGRPLAGASIGVEHAVRPNLAIALEVFIPVSTSVSDRVDRKLSIATAWSRVGVRTRMSLPWLELGASLHTGVALIWATARTREATLIGGTELAKAAIVSAGLQLESPDDSLLYLRATAGASRLVPSARVELGGGRTRDFGNLLVEIGLGVGVRWPRPESEP